MGMRLDITKSGRDVVIRVGLNNPDAAAEFYSDIFRQLNETGILSINMNASSYKTIENEIGS